MSEYRPPRGVNYRSREEIDLAVLSESLCKTAAFLQDVAPDVELVRYADWWEHDGLHFVESRLRFHDLFAMVGTPRDVFQSMLGDDRVFVGVSAADNARYLRFYAHWDDSGSRLIGRFDITIPTGLSERFEDEVVKRLGCELEKEDSEAYYNRVTPPGRE